MTEAILSRDEEQHVNLRSGLLAAFFVRRAASELGTAFRDVYMSWRTLVDLTKGGWCLLGANADMSKPFDASAAKRALQELDPAKAAKKTCFAKITGPEDTCGAYGWLSRLSKDVDGVSGECHVLETWFPSDPQGYASHLSWALEAGKLLDIESGYVAPALLVPIESDIGSAREVLLAQAFRHPGYDVSVNRITCRHLGDHSRGARWVNLLGRSQVAKLGGIEQLSAALGKEISVTPYGAGAMIRTSEAPEIGDVNRGDDLPRLRRTEKVLEPVTLFGDIALDSVLEDRREAWERRFLD